MINGKEYSFQDIQVAMLGKPIAGLTGIVYKEKTNRKLIHGTGRKAIAYADGETSYDGSISLLQSEMQALINSVKPGQSVTTLPPFDIIVMYIPSLDSPSMAKHVIKGVIIEEFEFSSKSGDLNQEITLPYKAADIDFNAN